MFECRSKLIDTESFDKRDVTSFAADYFRFDEKERDSFWRIVTSTYDERKEDSDKLSAETKVFEARIVNGLEDLIIDSPSSEEVKPLAAIVMIIVT